MRHRVSGKQLSRSTAHRRSLRRNMAASLFEHGAIRTTEAKAKELRRFVERLITIARRGTLHARRRVLALLGDRDIVNAEGELADKTVVQKLFDEIAPRYRNRPGGYTRIVRLSERRIGDAGVQVLLQLVEETPARAAEGKTPSRRRKRAAKRRQAAGAAAPEPEAGTGTDETAGETADEQTDTEEAESPDEAASAEAGAESADDEAESADKDAKS